MNYNHDDKKRNVLQKTIVILFWLCVWQLAAALTHNRILLVGPLQVGMAFLQNLFNPDFYKIVFFSLARIGEGFFCALFIGIFLGAVSYRFALSEMFLTPLITTLKSIPVASFVVLLIIWFGSGRLSFLISFLIVFPHIYVSTIAGLKSTDKQLLEMAEVFDMSRANRIFYLYRPALMPYLISSLKISLGMSWKSGVAAEVIGMPAYSLGERLYMSKIYLDTAGLFAWTLLIILLSFLFEKTVLYIVEKFAAWNPYPKIGNIKNDDSADCRAVHIGHVSKAYGEQQVLKDWSFTFEPGAHYCLMAPSGGGKTTLLRLINRTVQMNEGTIEGVPSRIGMVFQEDRLCDAYDTITNVMITMRNPKDRTEGGITDGQTINGISKTEAVNMVREEALHILPEECLSKPVSELSGGMKRRCAILRAMLSEADMIIMDEPFTGLDEENRRRTAAYILERLHGRTLVVTTHREEDVELLSAVKVEL